MARRSRPEKSGFAILVVDDQESILHSTRALLEREGHTVLTADSGLAALARLRESSVQLLLVDYFMPRMNGAELIKEIRLFEPNVQIILQTGYSGEKPPRQMLAELDIQGYHDKGRGPDDLLMWVDIALKSHRLLHRLAERERLQAELVANVSHEFRTPLNVIGGYTELVLAGDFGELQSEGIRSLQRVQVACHDLSELVSDFLRYARVEARVEEVHSKWIQTVELAGEMERLAGVLLEAKDVDFGVEIDDAPREFRTDSVKLKTILRNLVTNAAKFTAEGSIRIRFAREPFGLAISVADTGPGIPADSLELVFEPFRQLNGSMTRSHGGIGLGLALSRKLAKLLGGDLTVASEVGKGSVFTLRLPRSVLRGSAEDAATSASASGSIGDPV
jgi:signal transduction histidine kinase